MSSNDSKARAAPVTRSTAKLRAIAIAALALALATRQRALQIAPTSPGARAIEVANQK